MSIAVGGGGGGWLLCESGTSVPLLTAATPVPALTGFANGRLMGA